MEKIEMLKADLTPENSHKVLMQMARMLVEMTLLGGGDRADEVTHLLISADNFHGYIVSACAVGIRPDGIEDYKKACVEQFSDTLNAGVKAVNLTMDLFKKSQGGSRWPSKVRVPI